MECNIEYRAKFIEKPSEVFHRLEEELPLRSHEINIFGKKVMQPRQICWHGPGDYKYSGLNLSPDPWTDDLSIIRDQLRAELGIDFNSVLVNHYADGSQSVGWHADDETYFGTDPTIATISLGTPRLFCMKPKEGGSSKKFILENGSMFIMGPGTQSNWLHTVPKTKLAVGPRISLTYRVWNQP